MTRAPTPVRLIGPSSVTVKLETEPAPPLHPYAPWMTLGMVMFVLLLAGSWVWLVVLPTYCRTPAFVALDRQSGGASYRAVRHVRR